MFATIRRRYGWAITGLGITVLFVAYQHLIDFRVPAPPSTLGLTFFFTILCPPALLSIPIIDAEIGTRDFYILWAVIAVLNAMLYAIIGVLVTRLRKKLT